MTHYLIIGNGAAGVTAAERIRREDPPARITIVTAEPYPMYSRPGLAYVLNNVIPAKQIITRSLDWYQQLQIQLVLGKAISLNVKHRRVLLDNERSLTYDKLLIAVGARATPPPYPGVELRGVAYLDTMDGTEEMIRLARRARKAVVIGGGITAMEMVEGLAARGVETHYFLRRDRLWGKVFNKLEAEILESRMQEHHVHIHYHTEAIEILGNRRGKVRAVKLKDGSEFKCNLVGIGIGVKPQLELVKGTPVAFDRAILVNEFMQTNVPDLYAAGDCAQVYDRWSGKHMLDILWPSAVAEGNAAALNMAGKPFVYQKGSPFNACLLFGLHIASIGQINPRGDEMNESETLQHVSRGSSEVWFTTPHHHRSAWSRDGDNTLRLVLSGNRLVGALVLGDQTLADPIRYLVENEMDISWMREDLAAGGERMQVSLSRFWKELQRRNGVTNGRPQPIRE